LCDSKMDLGKQIFKLWNPRGPPQSKSCDLQTSQAKYSSVGNLTGLTQLTEKNLAALDATAHSEMRRAQTQAQHVRESSLARSQLARQLPR
jgi:hypothetical protein